MHGIGETWGALADGASRGGQVLYQMISIGAAWGWTLVSTAIIMLAIRYTIGERAREEEEQIGLDVSQHAEEAYSLLGDAFPMIAGG